MPGKGRSYEIVWPQKSNHGHKFRTFYPVLGREICCITNDLLMQSSLKPLVNENSMPFRTSYEVLIQPFHRVSLQTAPSEAVDVRTAETSPANAAALLRQQSWACWAQALLLAATDRSTAELWTVTDKAMRCFSASQISIQKR